MNSRMFNNDEHSRKMCKLNSNPTNNNNNIIEEEDRLSSLPDSILVEILSLLPFEFAVVTGILSRRWFRLWNQLTSLRLHSEIVRFGCHWKFYSVIDHLLHQLTSQRIDTFDFHFPTPPIDGCYLFTSLIRQICDRFPKQVKVNFKDYSHLVRVQLPSFVFECQSLEVLVLGFGFDYKLPDNGVNLPNLKKLDICVYEWHLDFLSKLVQSCLVLDDLRIEVVSREYEHYCIEISSANLKSLNISMVHQLKITQVVIDAPKLQNFSVNGPTLVKICFAKKPQELLNVKVCTRFDYEVGSKGRLEWDFVKSIANAKSLNLGGDFCPAFYYLNDYELPVFDGLTTLELVLHMPNFWKGLMRFLEHCPNLQVLRLSRKAFVWHGTSWIKLDSVPACLSTKVKSIMLRNFVGVEHELDLISYILLVATVLENLDITIVAPKTDKLRRLQLRKEPNFCRKLYRFPKSSDMCRIKVAGQCHLK